MYLMKEKQGGPIKEKQGGPIPAVNEEDNDLTAYVYKLHGQRFRCSHYIYLAVKDKGRINLLVHCLFSQFIINTLILSLSQNTCI